jgi:lipopolysaccharide export system protein LptC
MLNQQVKKILVPKQENPIINRLNKTKVEKFPNLGMEKAERLKEKAKKNHAAAQTQVSFPFFLFFKKNFLLFLLATRRFSYIEKWLNSNICA